MSGATGVTAPLWIALRRALVVSMLLSTILALAGVAAASAEMPWWALTSSASPTNLSVGSAKDEVQQLTVRATKGDFALVEVRDGGPDFEHFTILPFDATAAEVQEHLETEVFVEPSREVTVTGGPGDETGSKPYVITFPGQSVEPMLAVPLSLEGGSPESEATLTELAHGAEGGKVILSAENLGDGEVNGASTPVTVSDRLPPGVSATSIEGTAEKNERKPLKCSIASVSCSYPGTLTPYETLQVVVSVAAAQVPGEDGEARVTGGGAAAVSSRQRLRIGEAPTQTPFGVEQYALALEEEGGASDTQAGSHPFQLTSTLAFNQTADLSSPPASAKDVRVALPPGLIGNPSVVPQCSEAEFDTVKSRSNFCPADTAIGVATVTFSLNNVSTIEVPVFNLTPAAGEPARFGFVPEGSPVILDTSVRAGGDYGVVVSTNNLSEVVGLISSRITLWGVPDDPRHDASRGWECIAGGSRAIEANPQCGPPGLLNPPPFLTLPTSCSGPLQTTVEADSWTHPGSFTEPASYAFPQDGAGKAFGMDGCNRLSLDPAIEVTPETQAASTPTGLHVDLKVPQEGTLAASGLASSDVKDATVTLPVGMQVNPSSANGLEACPEVEPGGVGFTGFTEFQSGSPTATFTGTLPAEWGSGKNFCANGSKVGVVHIKTPLLSHELEGSVYVAEQDANPFGSLLALYIVAQDKTDGVLVKLAGEVHLNGQTGQIITTFKNTPQLPFEELRLEFFGGSGGPLSTPAACGTYTTTTSLTPWSAPESGPPATPPSAFSITSGTDGSACADPPPFAPALNAGSTNLQAGAFTPFITTMSREDGNQNLSVVHLHMPVGLLGELASVTPCREPQASLGTCGPESEVGHTTVSAGLGPDPYTIPGGKVFITGPYKGAPFGLSIAAPAKAGPFDLGSGPCDCVVVRSKIEIDPYTSALTITSDPLPTMLQGIPLQLKHVNVTIDRPGFTLNPTNCSQLAVTGTITGEQGASASESVPFEVANCATLPFKPGFSASTQAKTSKLDGASLVVKVTQKPGEANIHTVDLQLPVALPSRDSTLNKACTEAQFNANPAGCPLGSVIGTATAHTPVLQVPLTGPAYLVSRGGAAFPDVEYVLQADERGGDVEIVLDGKTQIKKAVTYSHFETVPDAPISSFETDLPEGPHSIFSTERPGVTNLCALSLFMPTTMVGQNGAQVTQSTKIAVTGCSPVTISRRKLAGRSVMLEFNLTTKGTVTVTGQGLKRYHKTLGAGSRQINVALSSAGISMYGHRGTIKIKVALRSATLTSSATTSLKL